MEYVTLNSGVKMPMAGIGTFLLTPDEAASTYTFNKHVVKHRFCPVCGMHPYGEGVDPKGNHIVAINVRCLEGIEPESLPVQHYDGRAL